MDYKQIRCYYLTDHLGSTRAVVDETGEVLDTFHYYSFGLTMPKRETDATGTPERFTGKERDDEGGLNLDYFGARYYDPALGRWLSVDPAADLQESISPYAFSLNSPINFIDPDGSLPIFINGKTSADSQRGDESYWDSQLLATIASSGIPNPGGTIEFVDGNKIGFSSRRRMRAHNHNATVLNGNAPSQRSLAGRIDARQRFKDILSQLERDPESGLITEKIQIYTHSRGAAFGVGFTDELMSLIKENADQFADPNDVIDFVLNLASHQSWALYSPDRVDAYSINHIQDPLSGNFMWGLNAAFTSAQGGIFGHANETFTNEVGAFLESFLSGGASKKTIDHFIQRAKEEYGIEVIVRQ